MFYKISDRNTASMKTILAKNLSVKGESISKLRPRSATLLITIYQPPGMAAIEDMLLHRFSLQQSRSLLLQNMSTLLCYAEAPDTGGSPCAHILHLIG